MSENKFRLVMKGKVVGYEKHDVLWPDKLLRIYHSKDYGKRSVCVWCDIVESPERYIDHDTEDRFTGLTDKNGVDVWERDRVKRKQGQMLDEGVVVWNDTGQLSGWFFMKDGIHPYRLFNDDTLEVIGRGKEGE